jgi:hypothetical protein
MEMWLWADSSTHLVGPSTLQEAFLISIAQYLLTPPTALGTVEKKPMLSQKYGSIHLAGSRFPSVFEPTLDWSESLPWWIYATVEVLFWKSCMY